MSLLFAPVRRPVCCPAVFDATSSPEWTRRALASCFGIALMLATPLALSAQSFMPNFVFNSSFDDELGVGGWESPPEAELTHSSQDAFDELGSGSAEVTPGDNVLATMMEQCVLLPAISPSVVYQFDLFLSGNNLPDEVRATVVFHTTGGCNGFAGSSSLTAFPETPWSSHQMQLSAIQTARSATILIEAESITSVSALRIDRVRLFPVSGIVSDVEVELTASETRVQNGGEFTLDFLVRNNGNAWVNEVALDFDYPAGLAPTPEWDCLGFFDGDDRWVLQLPLEPGAERSCSRTVEVTSASSVTADITAFVQNHFGNPWIQFCPVPGECYSGERPDQQLRRGFDRAGRQSAAAVYGRYDRRGIGRQSRGWRLRHESWRLHPTGGGRRSQRIGRG